MTIHISRVTKRLVYFYASICISIFCYQITKNSSIAALIVLMGLVSALIASYNDNETALWLMFILAYDIWGCVPILGVGNGFLHWYDLNIIVAGMLFIKYIKNIKKFFSYKFGLVYVFQLIFILIACYQSYRIYGQSVSTTLLTGRSLFVVFAFWPVICMIKNHRITKSQILKIMVMFAKVTIVIEWIEFILVNAGLDVTFAQTSVRWGTRIYFGNIVLSLYCYYCLYYILYPMKGQNNKRLYFGMVSSFLTVVVITQLRATFTMIAVAVVVMLFASKKVSKVIKMGALSLLILFLLLLTPFVQNAVKNVITELSGGMVGENGGVAVRVPIQQFYDNKLAGHELFGVGIPNNHYGKGVYYSGQYVDIAEGKYNNYTLTDLGSYYIKYQFGSFAYYGFYFAVLLAIIKGMRLRSKSVFAFISCSYFIMSSSGGLFMSWLSFAYLISRPFDMMLAFIFVEIANENDRVGIESQGEMVI